MEHLVANMETLGTGQIGNPGPILAWTSLGYARVSTHTQGVDAQEHRLQESGALRIFEDVIRGRRFDRPELTALIDYARPRDIVCVVRLDRLGRSLRELLETVETLKQKK
jgi:DNA invertase Pin-like site-specific DNA recombinase